MQKLDLKRIIKTANLKTSYLGAQLFPNNKDPKQAVNRVCRGEAFLDSEQIAKLSELLNVPIGLLFDNAEWDMSTSKEEPNIIRFRAYGYFAELNTRTMKTRVSLNGTVFFEEITHERATLIGDYLNDLTDLIIKYK